MNLSSFQSQARAVTPDGKLTPEFLRLLSAIVRDLRGVVNDQALDVFASDSGNDVASEVMGYETVTQSTTNAQDVCADVTQSAPSESDCCPEVFQTSTVTAETLSGTTLAGNVVSASISSLTPAGGVTDVTGDFKAQLAGASNGTLRGLKFAIVGDGTNYGSLGMKMSDGEVRLTAGFAGWGGYATTYVNGIEGLRVTDVYVRPGTDNVQACGDASYRWSVVYAATGTINTSDARDKTAPRPLNERETACALELAKTGPGVFQWLDAVEKKGDAARLHVGFTVQQVMAVMEKHGLDPLRYAFICYDKTPDRYGLRVDQLYAFINSAVWRHTLR